jgi:hypothetical protein
MVSKSLDLIGDCNDFMLFELGLLNAKIAS